MAKEQNGVAWIGRRDTCRQVKRDYMETWRTSVDYRRGKPFRVAPAEDTINVPADWSRTKNKTAQLFYQVPEVRLKARRPEYVGATSVFGAALNFQLNHKVKAQFMMNEVLGDVINAAGIGICKVGYEATFDEKPVDEQMLGQSFGQPPVPQTPMAPAAGGSVAPPAIPSPVADPAAAMAGVGPVAPPMPEPAVLPTPPLQENSLADSSMPQTVSMPVYECYYARRISPAHFLWPVEFTGSDWNEAPWIGWEGYIPLADAIRKGWVEKGFEGVGMTDPDWFLVSDFQKEQQTADTYVKFSEIFYRPSKYDVDEKDHNKIKRLVIVDGKKPEESVVVDEDLPWQRYNNGKWVGLTSFPIKVLTITNISDLAIPPSDSEIGRPQVRELIKGRSQMMRQREMSMPLRWFDINAIDALVVEKMRKGKWQDMIPMNGPGDHAIGEVARAQYPRETFQFDVVAKQDLDEAWSMGGPQQGSEATKADTTATEVKTAQSNLNVRLDYERSWVLRFFLEVAEGIGSLMQLFSDNEDWVEVVGQDGAAKLQAWDRNLIQGEYVFEAKPDSQLRLDVNARRTEILNLYKLGRKDPLINAQALVSELLETFGFDPTATMAKPEPAKPPQPKISFSFKGEDTLNPISMAVMMKSGMEITPEDILKAKKMIEDATGLPGGAAAVPAPGVPTNGPPPPQGPPTGQNAPHEGPVPVVEPIGQRFNQGMESTTNSGGEGKQ